MFHELYLSYFYSTFSFFLDEEIEEAPVDWELMLIESLCTGSIEWDDRMLSNFIWFRNDAAAMLFIVEFCEYLVTFKC